MLDQTNIQDAGCKEGLTLNLRQRDGHEVMLRLAAQADVLVEGFRPGAMDRLSLGFETLRQVNPELVYCSISGFGQDGELRRRPGHGLNYGGLAGIVDFGESSPWLVGLASDSSGSLYAAIAILAAMRHRDQHGGGEHIDVAITDTTYALMTEHMADGHSVEHLPPTGAFGVYTGADGARFTLAAVEDQFWVALCTVVDRSDWSADPRFIDDAGRRRHAGDRRDRLRARQGNRQAADCSPAAAAWSAGTRQLSASASLSARDLCGLPRLLAPGQPQP